VAHLQYEDDSDNDPDDEEGILNLKFILYYFENMSAMKINYHKRPTKER
jgi:hypothetical protein